MGNELTKEEREMVLLAIQYYKDEATTQDNGSPGLTIHSKEYKLLTSAVKKFAKYNK